MSTSEELTSLFKQLAQGMCEVNNYLVHRDIKPDNILLCGNILKISDFGLSKIAAENTRTMSFKGGGTPLYMAPEAWDLSKNTIQMDIYSMGIVFYEIAALQYPYTPIPCTLEDCKATHLYTAATSLSKITTGLSPFDSVVAMAIATKNAEDIARQEEEATHKRQQKEREDFLRLVYSQFQQTIITPIIEYAEKINSQYAGKEKITYPINSSVVPNQVSFVWKLNISQNNYVTIKFEAILKENFTRDVSIDRFYEGKRTRKENYIPQYRSKNILAWGEITNNAGYGFNILLLEGDDIYGDWIIMNNKNNFSHVQGKERQEPFAFSLHELPSEIYNVQITHLYSADFDEFNEASFLNLINLLAFLLK